MALFVDRPSVALSLRLLACPCARSLIQSPGSREWTLTSEQLPTCLPACLLTNWMLLISSTSCSCLPNSYWTNNSTTRVKNEATNVDYTCLHMGRDLQERAGTLLRVELQSLQVREIIRRLWETRGRGAARRGAARRGRPGRGSLSEHREGKEVRRE